MRFKKLFFIFLFLVSTWDFPSAFSATPLSLTELLQQLVRIDTSNPPGNEIKLAQWIQKYLGQFGIASQILESAPGRANLIARLKGDGSREPLALLGHLDVVPADPKEWTVPPFEGRIEGDYLYGRGVLDMKGLVALEIATLIRLKQEKTPLKGDVILVLTADEETGGTYGAKFLAEKHWEKIAAKYVFNEGSVGVRRVKRNLYPVQVAEKGVAWMKLTATGTSGHGSMPKPDNAVLRLINALERLASAPQPIQRTEVVEAFLEKTSVETSFPTSFFMRHLFDWPLIKIAPKILEGRMRKQKAFNAMIRNTVTPTMLSAGYKVNVIPSEATGFIDTRILPGETPENFLKQLEKKVNDPHVKLELVSQSAPNASDFHTPYFQTVEKAILAHDPNALVAPYMSPGATDTRFFREKGVLGYGIIPFVIPEEDIDTVHGKNERVLISELTRGEKILYDIVIALQGGKDRPSHR